MHVTLLYTYSLLDPLIVLFDTQPRQNTNMRLKSQPRVDPLCISLSIIYNRDEDLISPLLTILSFPVLSQVLSILIPHFAFY